MVYDLLNCHYTIAKSQKSSIFSMKSTCRIDRLWGPATICSPYSGQFVTAFLEKDLAKTTSCNSRGTKNNRGLQRRAALQAPEKLTQTVNYGHHFWFSHCCASMA
jgi:hypothetical protein